jgi:hypothetical protein
LLRCPFAAPFESSRRSRRRGPRPADRAVPTLLVLARLVTAA